MAQSMVENTEVADKTLEHLLPDLTRHLDLVSILDKLPRKLLSEGLITSDTMDRLNHLTSSGDTSAAIREVIPVIKRNPPGYLGKFVDVLKSDAKTEHYGRMIEEEYKRRVESDQPSLPQCVQATPNTGGVARTDGNDDEYFISRYITAIEKHKDKLYTEQRLTAYKEYLIWTGAITAKEFREIKEAHQRKRPQMEAMVDLLLRERDLQRFIGLSAVMYRYAEDDAEDMFSFVLELGDRHPDKGDLRVKEKSSVKPTVHLRSAATPSMVAPPPCACSNKLLWMVEDSNGIAAVRTVLTDMAQVSLSEPAHTEQVTYWEFILWGTIQVYVTYPEPADAITQTCAHMMESFKPDITLLTGTCLASDRIGSVMLGDIIVGKCAVKIESGADLRDENDKRFHTQTIPMSGRVVTDLEVESRSWEIAELSWLQRYRSKIPSRSISYQRLWYTRLYLELTREEADRTGWLEANRWNIAGGFKDVSNRGIMDQHIPTLKRDFKNQKYWKKGDYKPFPVEPVHSNILQSCNDSIVFGEDHFPKQELAESKTHFGSILTTTSQPKGSDVEEGNSKSNTVIAADMNSYHFYHCVTQYKSCKIFVSVKGVFLLDDGMSDCDPDITYYAQLSSAAYGLQAVKHLYSKID